MRTVPIYERWETDGPRAITAAAPEHDRKFVIALARGLDVLRAFTPTDSLLGNQEIAARAGLPKATVSRLTYTLTKLGYLTHIERLSKYTLAPAALVIGYSALIHIHMRQAHCLTCRRSRITPALRSRSAFATVST